LLNVIFRKKKKLGLLYIVGKLMTCRAQKHTLKEHGHNHGGVPANLRRRTDQKFQLVNKEYLVQYFGASKNLKSTNSIEHGERVSGFAYAVVAVYQSFMLEIEISIYRSLYIYNQIQFQMYFAAFTLLRRSGICLSTQRESILVCTFRIRFSSTKVIIL